MSREVETPRKTSSVSSEAFDEEKFEPCTYDEMIYLVEFLKNLKFFSKKSLSDV